MEKERLEKAMIEERFAMKTMTRSLVNQEIILCSLGTEKRLLTKSSKELLFSSLTNLRRDLRTKYFLKNISLVLSRFTSSVEKEVLKYCGSGVYELVPLVSELIKIKNRKVKK